MLTAMLLAFAAGTLSLATPCFWLALPLLALRDGRSGGRQILLGVAAGFTLAAGLATLTADWAAPADAYARGTALVLLALFGVTLLWPRLTAALLRPANVLLRLRAPADGALRPPAFALGLTGGMVWTPCAGPFLATLLLHARSGTEWGMAMPLFFAFGLGMAVSAALLVRLARALVRGLRRRWTLGPRIATGLALLCSVLLFGFGLQVAAAQLPEETLARGEQSLANGLEGLTPLVRQQSASPAMARPIDAFRRTGPWPNRPALDREALRGKVVLVNFWTYSCINCLRTLPHIKAWAGRYGPRGLVVIGVHAPEFAFERDPGNVRLALRALGIVYPTVQDNDFAIWRAFGNSAWPGFFLVGRDGQVRYRKLGEEDYEATERAIQAALGEAPAVAYSVSPSAAPGTQASPDWQDLASPETYVGYGKAERFGSREPLWPDRTARYSASAPLIPNHWSLAGLWTARREFALAGGAGSALSYRFRARDLHLVMAPDKPGQPIHFRVLIDGKAPGDDHGSDIDRDGYGALGQAKLYQLVRQSGAVREHLFEIAFSAPGARAYAFTFG